MTNNHLFDNIIPRPIFDFRFSTLMLMRCTKREFAKQFQDGKIRLGSPKQWIELEEQGKIGQGDLLEGVFFSVQENDESEFVTQIKNSPGIDHFTKDGYLFFRRRTIINLRCLCLYGLHDNSFCKEILPDGRASYITKIPRSYFSDFSETKSRKEYKKIESPQQPVVILIGNPNEFFNRIRSFLSTLDVKADEIIISPVEYLDRYTNMLSVVIPPMELLIKDQCFANQSEVRIIINSQSPKYIKYMIDHNSIIDIGSLTDITEIYDYYYEDMKITRVGNRRAVISLPEAKTMNIHDFDYIELEDLLVGILQGTVKLNGLPEGIETWDEKLQLLKDLFYSKFGVQLHVDQNNNVTLYNLSDDLLNESKNHHKCDRIRYQFENKIDEFMKEHKYDAVTKECLDLLDDNTLVGVTNYYLGKVYAEQLQFDDAEKAFEKAIKEDYKRIESRAEIAGLYFQKGDYYRAIEKYELVQEEKGFDSRIWCNIGVCYLRLKEYHKTIEYCDKAIELNTSDAYPYYYKGAALYWLKEYEQTKALWEKAIELDPNNAIFRREYEKFISYLAFNNK